MLEIFERLAAKPVNLGNPKLFKMLPVKLKQDRAIAIAALTAGCVALDQLDVDLLQVIDFWQAVLVKTPQHYVSLPLAFQNDRSLAHTRRL